MHEWNSSKKPYGRQCNRLLDTLVKIIKYKKSKIDHAIYIKVSYVVTMYYLTVSTDSVLNTTNNGTAFHELTIFFEEHFEMKVQEGSVLENLNFRIRQSPLGLSVDNTNHMMYAARLQ